MEQRAIYLKKQQKMLLSYISKLVITFLIKFGKQIIFLYRNIVLIQFVNYAMNWGNIFNCSRNFLLQWMQIIFIVQNMKKKEKFENDSGNLKKL